MSEQPSERVALGQAQVRYLCYVLGYDLKTLQPDEDADAHASPMTKMQIGVELFHYTEEDYDKNQKGETDERWLTKWTASLSELRKNWANSMTRGLIRRGIIKVNRGTKPWELKPLVKQARKALHEHRAQVEERGKEEETKAERKVGRAAAAEEKAAERVKAKAEKAAAKAAKAEARVKAGEVKAARKVERAAAAEEKKAAREVTAKAKAEAKAEKAEVAKVAKAEKAEVAKAEKAKKAKKAEKAEVAKAEKAKVAKVEKPKAEAKAAKVEKPKATAAKAKAEKPKATAAKAKAEAKAAAADSASGEVSVDDHFKNVRRGAVIKVIDASVSGGKVCCERVGGALAGNSFSPWLVDLLDVKKWTPVNPAGEALAG